MMDLVTSGFSVDLEDFDFLEDLDERDFLDLDEHDFLDFVFERWLSPWNFGKQWRELIQ